MNYHEIEPLALEKIPEIWDDYLLELGVLGQHHVDRLQWIKVLSGLAWSQTAIMLDSKNKIVEVRRLGESIVFDSLIVPYLVELIKSGNFIRLEELFDWFEVLASNDRIRKDLIEVTLCESLLSNQVEYLEGFYKFIYVRPHLLRGCKNVSWRFLAHEPVLRLFDQS